MFEYTLIRTNRKTVAIYIRPTGEVEVRAPGKVSRKAVEEILHERESWIRSKQQPILEIRRQKQDFCITDQSKLLYLGKEYPVQYGDSCEFDGSGFTIPRAGSEEVRLLLIKVYKKLAKDFLTKRVQTYAQATGFFPNSVRINSANTRWGSCSGKNGLNFSWKLIMAPVAAVDYVVVHELAHTKEHNHSPRFWKLVEAILPHYREREKLLVHLRNRLVRENWDTCLDAKT